MGIFEYFKMAKNGIGLNENLAKFKEESQYSLKRLQRMIAGFIVLLENAHNKIQQISLPKDNNNATQDLTDFLVQLRVISERFNVILNDISHNKDIPTSQLLEDIGKLIGDLPAFISSVEYVLPAEILSGLPQSLPELEESFQALVASYVEDTFLVDLMKQLKEFTTEMLASDAESVREFAKSSHSKQDAVLYAYHNVNEVMKKITIWMDEIEEKYNIKKGALLKEIKLGLNFSNNPGLIDLSIQKRPLDAFFEEFKNGYEARINAMQHREGDSVNKKVKREEVYPFTYAILRAKVRKQERAIKEYADELERDMRLNEEPSVRVLRKAKELNIKVYQRAAIDINQAIEKGIADNKALVEKENISADVAEKREVFLSELLPKLALGEDVIPSAKTSPHYKCDHIKKAIQSIEEVMEYQRVIVVKREEKKGAEIAALKEKLAKNMELLNAPAANEYADFEADTLELNDNIRKLVRQTYDEVSALFKVTKTHTYSVEASEAPIDSEESQSLLDNFKEKMEFVGQKLEEALDRDVFDAYFSGNNPQMGELPWIGEVGQVYLGINNMIERIDAADKVITDKEGKRPDNSPLKNINNVVKVALEGERAAVQVIRGVEGFLANTTFHQARDMLANHKVSIRQFTDMVKNDPWVVFALGKGLESVKQLGRENKAENALESAREFYAYASEKFGHDKPTRDKINEVLIKIKGVVSDSNKELTEDSSKIDTTMYFLRHAKEFLLILPNLSQIKNSLAKASKDEGLQILSRLNGMLRVIFEYADAIEIAFHLKEGYIAQQLLQFEDGTSFYSYLEELHADLNKSGYGFAKDNVYPYRLALHQNRENKMKTVTRDIEMHKIKEKESLAKKINIENTFIVNKEAHKLAIQASGIAIDNMIGDFINFSVEIRKLAADKNAKYKSLADDNYSKKMALQSDLLVLNKLISEVIPAQLRAYNRHVRDQLPANADKSIIKMVEQKIGVVNDEILNCDLLLNELSPDVTHGSGAPAAMRDDALHQQLNAKKDEIGKELTKFNGLIKKAKLADDILRLRALQAKPIPTLDEKCERIHLEDMICGLNKEYRQALIDLHLSQVSAADLLVTQKLLQKRMQDVPLVTLVDSKVAKKTILALLDAEINQLKSKRYNSYLLFTQSICEKTLRKLDGLQFIREKYARDGYFMQDALDDLRAEKANLYTFMYDYYKPFYDELRALDRQIKVEERGYYVVDAPSPRKKQAPALDAQKEQLIDARIAILNHELANSYFFKSTKEKKIQLLTSLKSNLKEGTFKEALHKVQTKYGSMATLLFEGRTGKMLKRLEIDCSTKEEMIAKIDSEIARLAHKKSGFAFFFVQFRSKRVDARIAALTKFKDGSKLSDDEWAILRKYESRVIEGCMALQAQRKLPSPSSVGA